MRKSTSRRGGFTLLEMLCIVLIVLIVTVLTATALNVVTYRQRVQSASAQIVGQLQMARSLALVGGLKGIRLEAEPSSLVLRADGTIDPDSPIVFRRVVPIESTWIPGAGRVRMLKPGSAMPPGFIPMPGMLMLEQIHLEPRTVPNPIDPSGAPMTINLLAEPTSWDGSLRRGDRVRISDRSFTIVGPCDGYSERDATGPGYHQANPEQLVHYGDSWPLLDRGDGPHEYLFLVNDRDDDRDGYINNGFNGLDENMDGVVDGPGEGPAYTAFGVQGEIEEWGIPVPDSGKEPTDYGIWPRPIPSLRNAALNLSRRAEDQKLGGTDVVIEGLGMLSGSTRLPRGRLPIDPLTGNVELVFDAGGSCRSVSRYATRQNEVMTPRWFHLVVSDLADVGKVGQAVGWGSSVVGKHVDSQLISIECMTGRVVSIPIGDGPLEDYMRSVELGVGGVPQGDLDF